MGEENEIKGVTSILKRNGVKARVSLLRNKQSQVGRLRGIETVHLYLASYVENIGKPLSNSYALGAYNTTTAH